MPIALEFLSASSYPRSIVRLRLALGLSVIACAVGAAPVQAETVVGLVPGNKIVIFDTASPAVTTTRQVNGLGANQTLRGIDQRPATLELYGTAVTTAAAANSILYTYRIDPNSGEATFLGQTAAALAGAADVPTGYDFAPTTDLMRYVNTNDENSRLNPGAGQLQGNDTDLTPAATSTIIAAALDRNVKDAEQTTVYAIDRNDSQLSIEGGINGAPSPNGGVITDIAPLGFNLNAVNDGGFDITREGIAYAALTDAADNLTRLYRIALVTALNPTPVATSLGLIGNGQTEVRSMTILSPRPAPAQSPLIGPPAPPPDTLKPVGFLVFKPRTGLGVLRRTGLKGRFSCSEACRVVARLTLGKTVLAGGRADLADAGVGNLTLRPTKAGKGDLPGKGALKASVTATFTDGAGNASTATRKLGLSR